MPTSPLPAPTDLLFALGRALRTAGGPGTDNWRELADAVDHYAEGKASYADYLRVYENRAVLLGAMPSAGERAKIEAWFATLRKPAWRQTPFGDPWT
jgi:hypothetical protein